MFAGVAGAGAEEGWYLTQLELELEHATGADITAGNGLAWRTLSGGMAISQPGRQSESELVERGGSKFPRTLNCRLSIGANPMGEEKIRDTFWLLLVVA